MSGRHPEVMMSPLNDVMTSPICHQFMTSPLCDFMKVVNVFRFNPVHQMKRSAIERCLPLESRRTIARIASIPFATQYFFSSVQTMSTRIDDESQQPENRSDVVRCSSFPHFIFLSVFADITYSLST